MANGKRNYEEWSKEELIREILALKKQKTYGLVWEREKTKEEFDLFINWEGEKTKEEFSPESKDKFPVLAEVKDKEISTDKEKPVNLLIEGDNYHSLAVLNFTHKGAIDVIYIDPPYNTGNKDFKYNDKFVDREDGYRHSKWISFMSKRLALAKNLLKDTGVIFISIDDNEQAQLKLLCDDLFGEENFLETIIWKKRATPPNDRSIGRIHEYIHTYAKNIKNLDLGLIPRDEKSKSRYSNPDNDPKGDWVASDLSASGKGGRLVKSCIFPIRNPKNNRMYSPPEGKCWLFNKEKIDQFLLEGKITFRENSGAPFLKRYLSEVRQGVTTPTILSEHGYSFHSAKEIDEILQKKGAFEHPKPLLLIKTLLQLSTKKESVVLDFFAGSGTTGHAVLEMNHEDNGNRRFILCTNNEDNNGTGLKIAHDICFPRVGNALKQYSEQNGGLKYFKTDFVEAAPTDKNKRKLVDKCTEMLCIKENAFDKVKDAKKFKIFKNNEFHLGIIFDDEYIEDFVKEAEKINGKFNVYVFSHDDSVPTKEFKAIRSRVTLCPIPETILKVYRKVFKND